MPLQSCYFPVQNNLSRGAELAWQISMYLWRGTWNFKMIFSRPLFTMAVCHFGPDSDLDCNTLARTLWTEPLWTETFCTETFWKGTLWLETLWTKELLKTHFGPTHFGLICFLSCSLLFFNFEIHFNVKINKLFLCLLWTRQSCMTSWRRKKNTQIFSLFILTLKRISE